MLFNRSIAARMALLVLLGAGGILGATLGYSYYAVRRMLMDELKFDAEYMAKATVNRIETVGRSVEKVVQGMAIDLEMNNLSTNAMYQLLRRTLAGNSNIYGAAIALNPLLNSGSTNYCAPYVYREKGALTAKDLGAGNYHYDVWDWFNLPQKLNQPVWCEPYFDEAGGNVLMVTYSCPVFKADRFYGVVTSDVALEWLTDVLAKISKNIGGSAWLISANGTFITHPKLDLIMKETVFSVAEAHPDPLISAAGRRVGQRMIRGETDFVPFTSVVSGKKGWLVFAPIPATDWSLGVMFLRETIMEYIFDLNKVSLVLGMIGFTLLLIVALGIARSIASPLRRLADATHLLAEGKLDAPLPRVKGKDEVARLAVAFERMREDLKKYIAKLQESTVARERIQSELRIAHAIQMDLVPKTFPPFPDRHDLDIFGVLDPAREVGGDFYDFSMPDERHIFLFVGDVSGKGMPAALFMAVSRTLLRSICREERNPAVILRRLNKELAEGNDSNMFVTIFCALVDIESGECRFSNGGHNPPFIVRQSGAVERLPLTNGCAVGIIPGMDFGEAKAVLRRGETLFIYSDGVTEAMNPAEELFGEERLKAELSLTHGGDCARIVQSVRETLRRYAAGAEQSDDVTMLVLRLLSKT